MTEQTAVGFRSDRGPVLIALMLSTGLVAIEATITRLRLTASASIMWVRQG